MTSSFETAAIVRLAGVLLATCLVAGSAGAEPTAEGADARPSSTWDDRHMQTRFPRHTPSRSGPRLILPEGSERNTISEGRTLYATPDRNWQSGPSGVSRSRRGRSSGLGATIWTTGSATRGVTSRSSSVRGSSMSTRR